MDKALSDKLLKLKVEKKIKINGKIYTTRERSFHKSQDKYHSNLTRYELGNDYVLEYDWSWHFFQLVRKEGWFFKTVSSKGIRINDIKILK